MKSLITLVVLCNAFFVTLNAAPVPPSGYESERQQSDEMRDGSIQADSILRRTFVNVISSLLSAASKTVDPNDQLQQSLFNGFNRILSSIGKRLGDEFKGGEIQSDAEMMQTLFGTILTKSTDNGGAHVQSDSDNGALGQILLNAARELFSGIRKKSNPTAEVPLTILDGVDSILSVIGKQLDEGQSVSDNEVRQTILDVIDNVLSTASRNADPNDEMTQTFINGFKTLFSLVRNKIENGGVIQSSDGEMKQTFMNFLTEIQTDSDDDGRTFINILKAIFSAFNRNTNPNNEFAKDFFNGAEVLFSAIGKVISNGGSQPVGEDELILSHFNSILSAFMKWIENGKIQSTDRTDEAKTQLWSALATGVLNKYLDG